MYIYKPGRSGIEYRRRRVSLKKQDRRNSTEQQRRCMLLFPVYLQRGAPTSSGSHETALCSHPSRYACGCFRLHCDCDCDCDPPVAAPRVVGCYRPTCCTRAIRGEPGQGASWRRDCAGGGVVCLLSWRRGQRRVSPNNLQSPRSLLPLQPYSTGPPLPQQQHLPRHPRPALAVRLSAIQPRALPLTKLRIRLRAGVRVRVRPLALPIPLTIPTRTTRAAPLQLRLHAPHVLQLLLALQRLAHVGAPLDAAVGAARAVPRGNAVAQLVHAGRGLERRRGARAREPRAPREEVEHEAERENEERGGAEEDVGREDGGGGGGGHAGFVIPCGWGGDVLPGRGGRVGFMEG
ncbi:hypothetical protein EDC01DRAFT_744595 [Geopyxis carbonaria]|nr:hypothetical protein EDC01DRAFT_744595 [Geopyxis carbonaria]